MWWFLLSFLFTFSSVWAEPMPVLATTGMLSSLVSEVGGSRISIDTLISPLVDPHSYSLVKGDSGKCAKAKVIFANGLGLECNLAVRSLLEKKRAIFLGDKLDEKTILTVRGTVDPHIWMDPSLFAKTIPFIVQALSKEDPEGAFFYEKNGEALLKKMQELDERIFQKIQSIPEKKRYLVTSHDAFHYFARRYLAENKEENFAIRCIAPEGLAPDSQISFAELKSVENHIIKYQIGVIFSEQNLSTKALQKIIERVKKQIKVRIAKSPLYGDSMPESLSYFEMMLKNADSLYEEWNYGN